MIPNTLAFKIDKLLGTKVPNFNNKSFYESLAYPKSPDSRLRGLSETEVPIPIRDYLIATDGWNVIKTTVFRSSLDTSFYITKSKSGKHHNQSKDWRVEAYIDKIIHSSQPQNPILTEGGFTYLGHTEPKDMRDANIHVADMIRNILTKYSNKSSSLSISTSNTSGSPTPSNTSSTHSVQASTSSNEKPYTASRSLSDLAKDFTEPKTPTFKDILGPKSSQASIHNRNPDSAYNPIHHFDEIPEDIKSSSHGQEVINAFSELNNYLSSNLSIHTEGNLEYRLLDNGRGHWRQEYSSKYNNLVKDSPSISQSLVLLDKLAHEGLSSFLADIDIYRHHTSHSTHYFYIYAIDKNAFM